MKFIDIFSGIGGFRSGLEKAGHKCIGHIEIDKYANKSYEAIYGGDDLIGTDIRAITDQRLREFRGECDLVVGGFPCQAFSVAGHRKGFEDTRGTLFFDIARIAKYHKPQVMLLENVKGLIGHDKGQTFKTIIDVLTVELGYHVQHKVLNTAEYANIPQNRERIYIVATKRNIGDVFPQKIQLTRTITDILNHDKQDEKYYYNKHRYYPQLQAEITKFDTVYQWRRHYVRENKNKLCPTLTANMGTGGHNVPLIKDSFGIRKLTPKECLSFQGFDESFQFPDLPESQKFKQVGNSISVPVATAIIKNILRELYNG